MNLLYLAKAGYGGWVSFTIHLAKKYKWDLYKISQKGERKKRLLGYETHYQNLSLEQIEELDEPILITACSHHYTRYLKYLEGQYIVIHDPTELKGDMKKYLPYMNVITIRESVHRLLKEKYDINNTLILHPLYDFPCPELNIQNKKGAISISRIDFDKNTDIIINANDLLKDPIDIYGCVSDLYKYHKLRETNFDKFYKGKFGKDFSSIIELLKNKKYCVDMSSIYKDGGGSQYTFLEAIKLDCCLILNKKWVDNMPTKFINGHNCFIVESPEELALVIKTDHDTSEIVKNAREMLDDHLNCDWNSIVGID